MQIKKRTLYILCPIIAVVLILGYIAYADYKKKAAEERDILELMASFEKECEREYQTLLNEYELIIETIKDHNYSIGLRFKYVMKLNKLLDVHNLNIQQYENTGWEYSTVNNCISDLSVNENKDKELLKQKAYQKVHKEWFK